MFFRRKQKNPVPKMDEDGFYYAEEGEDYDSDEFETDSDYSHDSDDDNISDEEDGELEDPKSEAVVDSGGDEGQVVSTMAAGETSAGGSVIASDGDERSGDGELCKWPSSSDESYEHVKSPSRQSKSPTRATAASSSNHLSVNGGTLELESHESDGDDPGQMQNIELESVNLNESPSKLSPLQADNISEQSEKSPPLPSSLDDDRSLLAIAAEQDRVDVVKAILQPRNTNGNSDANAVALVQLFLNNTLVKNNNQFTEDDLEPVFLPPLHIAIASSSTNVASCFLRMGANPAIRPNIPKDWSGPNWKDENGNDLFTEEKWKVIHRKSAWEIAFGPSPTNVANGEEGTEGKKDAKKGWFGFGSSKVSSAPEDSKETNDVHVKIDKSKLEGIKHAFTAEALRAIGSDEVLRLTQLLNSGLGSTERIEIGGKDLFRWCQEMNATKCIEMIQHKFGPVAVASDSAVASSGQGAVASSGNAADDSPKIANPIETKDKEEDDDTVYDASTLLQLQNKFEESEELVTAMSQILDNLAEEVSVTQGLLMQDGDFANNALISQVRSLKQQRGDIDDEVTGWEYKIADLRAELYTLMAWWKNRGGTESDIDFSVVPETEKVEPMSDVKNLTQAELKAATKKILVQIESSENKVKKIRASITELSEENNRNIAKVEELGLVGAVNLTRKLKEEVKEERARLRSIIQEESELRAKVHVVRSMLAEDNDSKEKKETIDPPTIESTTDVSQENPHSLVEEPESLTEDIIESHQPETPLLQPMNDASQVTRGLAIDDDNFESNCSYSEHSSDSDQSFSDSDSESYSDESYDGMRHSDRIQQGKSNALSTWTDDGDLGVFTFKVWDLLTRIFGLSKYAIKKTAKSTVEEVVHMPRVMII